MLCLITHRGGEGGFEMPTRPDCWKTQRPKRAPPPHASPGGWDGMGWTPRPFLRHRPQWVRRESGGIIDAFKGTALAASINNTLQRHPGGQQDQVVLGGTEAVLP